LRGKKGVAEDGEGVQFASDETAGGEQAIDLGTASAEKNTENSETPDTDLLSIILKQLQEDKIERERVRKEDREVYERMNSELRGELKKMSENLINTVQSDIDKLNSSILQRVENETGKLSQEMCSVRTETQQEIEEHRAEVERSL